MSNGKQKKRAAIEAPDASGKIDPMKHWKLSPMDTESVRRWWDYTAAYQRMIKATHTPWAPWHIVPADDKRARG
jgi:polyphosphate kinase 2 (PPK2 family)